MNDDETLEEAVHSWFAEYFAEGRSKRQLTSYLRAMPDAAPLLIDEIIEHLENSRKEFLGKPTDIAKEMLHLEIYEVFKHGPHNIFHDADTPVKSDHPAYGWGEKSYDAKIYEITNLFPNYKKSYLEKIISLKQNQ